MKPETPILMMTLQIPVRDDLSVEQVLDAIGEQLSAALKTIKRQQAEQAERASLEDPEAIPQAEFNATLVRETEETFSDDTRDDLLAQMGYTAQA